MLIKGIYYKFRYGKPVIIVSGLPRSGTSMIMQMLEAGGLEIATDKLRCADDDNPKGYYELEKVKELDKCLDKSWLQQYKGKAIKIISFLLKELPFDLNYKIIFIERDIDEVLASQQKMLQNRNEKEDDINPERMRENYRNHLRRLSYWLKHTPNVDVLYMQHNDVLNDPLNSARKICRFLGKDLNLQAMAVTVDTALYRNRRLAESAFLPHEMTMQTASGVQIKVSNDR